MREKMKDSGVEWIGSVPQDWDRRRLKDIAALAGRIGWQGLTSEEYKDEGPYLITGVDFTNGGINWDSCVHIEHKRWIEAADIRINNGDLLITKDGTVGKVAMCSGLDGLASLNSGIMVVRPKVSWDKRFMYWLLQSSVFWGWFNDINAGNSTITHLYQRDFYNFFFFAPSSKKAQALIANKLDGLIEKLDRAVGLLQQQIEALEAYKKSLIHEAVTKGLDSSVPMKDSGIGWIGQIPIHWGVNRLRYVATMESGATPSKDVAAYWEGDIPWVSSGEVKGGILKDTSLHISRSAINENSLRVLPQETLVMVVRSGILQHTLPVAVLDKPMAVNQDVKALSFSPSVLPKYFYYFIVGNNNNLLKALMKDKSTVDNVNSEYLKSLRVHIPPLEEQQQIAAYLDERCGALDRALELKREQLELLKQQRRSLIFEYVTGKRRVSQEQ